MGRSIMQEPGAWFLAAFIAGFTAAWGVTAIRHAGHAVWPFRETVTAHGTHFHHGDWGLLVLAVASAASFVVDGHPRVFAVIVGAAAGVAVDEAYQFANKTVDPAHYGHPAKFAIFAICVVAIGAGVALALA